MRLRSLLLAVSSLVALPVIAFDEPYKVIPDTGLWNVDNDIVYLLDPAGSDDLTADDSELDALRAAFRAWTCVPGAKLPLVQGEGAGPHEVNLSDNKNTLFWDEEGDLCGMGPGTLGVAVGPLGGGIKTNTDICFNGRDSTWGVGVETDVQSIALHEIGHWLGLAHPCDDDQDPTSCLPVEESLMFPQWSGNNDREPLASDMAGVQALYPLGEGEASSCTAPFNEFERCGCSDECADGMKCFPDGNGENRCGRSCSTADRDCGANGTCLIDTAEDGGGSGFCVRLSGKRPIGAICSSDGQCANDNCGAIIALGASVCLFQCDADSECEGGTCFDGFCLGNAAIVECPVAEEDAGCGCASVPTTSTTTVSLGAALGALWLLRRRRRA